MAMIQTHHYKDVINNQTQATSSHPHASEGTIAVRTTTLYAHRNTQHADKAISRSDVVTHNVNTWFSVLTT